MTNPNQNPEQQARDRIDEMLRQAGWVIQDFKALNPGAGSGVAVREYQTDTGPVDYALLVDRRPVGIIEAKAEEKAEKLNQFEDQAERYANSKLKWTVGNETLPFVYLSTSEITKHWDMRDPKPRSREVFWFHRPETLKRFLDEGTSFRNRLAGFPAFDSTGLRDCQVSAITELEKSFAKNKPRALIQMATGSGKTFTAITSIYRLLKEPVKANRVLFLVDTKNLGKQAEQEFQSYTPSDDKRKFTELYPVQRLESSSIDGSSKVYISTIQRMYSILKGEELDESIERESPHEASLIKEPVPVDYNPKVPIEMFDVIIIDECHRSIYNLWRQVLEYFDAFLVGLTATPDNRTYGFFNENVVSEYTHEDAVADGVNVGYEPYLIKTKVGEEGAVIPAQMQLDIRHRMTRKKRWEQSDEEVTYSKKELDRSVVNPSQIRTVVKEFKRAIEKEIFPKRKELPKTLIFAKTDSHANDIIDIVREEFGEGNDFCKKVTYQSEEDPESVLAQFRTTYNPRVAVTVDMIATGTDVKPLEVLLFMRDVKSKNYFEQMKGRGTRTLDADSLQKVTPSAATRKSHFVIVDAVGVLESVKTDSRPLERKKTVSLKELMNMAVMGQRDEDVLMSLASRISRMEKQVDEQEKKRFQQKSGGKSIYQVVHQLLDANDPDRINELVERSRATENPITAEQANRQLAEEACKVFDNPEFREYVENVRKSIEQIIDTHNLDKVTFSGFQQQSEEKAKEVVHTFRRFLDEKRNELMALRIFYSEPYRRKEVTFAMIKELHATLTAPPYNLTIDGVWDAYEKQSQQPQPKSLQRTLTDIVSLIRVEMGTDSTLRPFADIVRKNFQDWVFAKQAGATKFTEEQMQWLHMIRDHIITSMHLDHEDLELGRMAQAGGLAKMYRLFGAEMDSVMDELNEVLAA